VDISMKEVKTCLFCQTENETQHKENAASYVKQNSTQQCRHCGMDLPDKHPNDRKTGVKFFVKAFWLIALFCLIMVFYLPR